MLKLDNRHLEFVCVLFFLGILTYTGMATIMDYRLRHEFPYGYMASDAFWDLAQQTHLKDSGNYRYMPHYMRAGFKDTVGFHMPIYPHIVVIFSHLSGLPVHDSNLVVPFLFSMLSALIFYVIVRKFNKNIAIIGLAFTVFLYFRNFPVIYTWGVWDIAVTSSFLLASMWALNNLELKHSPIILGIFSSAVVLTHITEGFYLGVFIMVFLAFRLLKKKLQFSDIKKIMISGVISLGLSFYYLIIFKNGYGKSSSSFSFNFTKPEWYDVTIGQFGITAVLIAIGLVISIYFILTKEEPFALLAGIYLLFAGYTNFIDPLGPRAMQMRYFWPIYLSALAAITIYLALTLLIKNWKFYFSVVLSVSLAVVLVGAYHTAKPSEGIMDKLHWDAFTWVWGNTHPDSRLLFFYGDRYTQEAVLFNTKRVGYRVNFNDFRDSLLNRSVKRYYNAEVAAADDGELPYRKSFFKFGYYYEEKNLSDFFGPQDICKFDYYIFDKVSGQPALAQYNLIIASELLKKEFIKKAFENPALIILKNEKPGADCIEPRRFE